MKKFLGFKINNGFRDRVVAMVQYPIVRVTFGLFMAVVIGLMFFKGNVREAGLVTANVPLFFKMKFDKNGLSGDNLKFLDDLEKRIALEQSADMRAELMKMHEEATKEMKELAVRFKEFDADKVKLLQEILGTDEKGVRSILQKQGETLARLEAKLKEGPEDLSIRGQVIKWREENKNALAKIKSGEKAELTKLEIRLNSPMTPANSLNNATNLIPRPEFESGATEIVRPRLTFWDFITKGRSSSATYVWVNKKNPEGAAGWIGPGVAKPGVSLELGAEVSNAKKVAASEKVAMELLEDVEGFSSYIEQELRFQVDKETNSKLMTGVASATVPAGIQTISVAYTLNGVQTEKPNNWDAIRAVVAQLRAGNLDGAVTVFINPVDKANMDLTKLPAQAMMYKPEMPDATIIEDNNIPVGSFQAAILQYYYVKIYKDYTVTYGWENDDFTKNLVTLVGERRIHQYFKENHTGAFVFDTFANVKSAIDAEAV